jgi:hypothetical protein
MSIKLWKRSPLAGPVLRVLCVLAALQLAASVWTWQRARASLGEAMLSLGAQLMLYANARSQSPPRELVLNGLGLHMSTGTSSDPPATVLAAFAAMCKTRAGNLARSWAAPSTARAAEGREVGLLDGVLRVGDDTRGALACFDVGTPELSLEEFVGRAQRVAETGDFAQLGALRYVSVEGSASGSFFVATFSEGPLSLAKAFPAAGDAPGRDPELVPRPASARRILSAFSPGRDESANVYVSPDQSVEQLARFYRAQLPQRGFKLLPGPESSSGDAFIAEREGRVVAFSFSKTPEGRGAVTISAL